MSDEGPYVNGRVPPHEQTCEPGDLQRAQDIETIAYLREALIESKRETIEARAAAGDVEPWLWSDDDTAQTVESMGNLMTVRITGGHLRALIAGAVQPTPVGEPCECDIPSPCTYQGVRTCLGCKRELPWAKTFGPNETAQQAREMIAQLCDEHLRAPIRSLPTLSVRDHYVILESIKRAALDGNGYL